MLFYRNIIISHIFRINLQKNLVESDWMCGGGGGGNAEIKCALDKWQYRGNPLKVTKISISGGLKFILRKEFEENIYLDFWKTLLKHTITLRNFCKGSCVEFAHCTQAYTPVFFCQFNNILEIDTRSFLLSMIRQKAADLNKAFPFFHRASPLKYCV